MNKKKIINNNLLIIRKYNKLNKDINYMIKNYILKK